MNTSATNHSDSNVYLTCPIWDEILKVVGSFNLTLMTSTIGKPNITNYTLLIQIISMRNL
jgi:hypothetical protein